MMLALSQPRLGPAPPGRRREAPRRGGSHYPIPLLERRRHLHADFQADAPVPVDGHVAPGWQLAFAGKGPDQAASLPDGRAELRAAHLPAHDGDRNARQSGEADVETIHCVAARGRRPSLTAAHSRRAAANTPSP